MDHDDGSYAQPEASFGQTSHRPQRKLVIVSNANWAHGARDPRPPRPAKTSTAKQQVIYRGSTGAAPIAASPQGARLRWSAVRQTCAPAVPRQTRMPTTHGPYTAYSKPHLPGHHSPPASWLSRMQRLHSRKRHWRMDGDLDGDRLWQPPAHMPGLPPQPMSFFSSLGRCQGCGGTNFAT